MARDQAAPAPIATATEAGGRAQGGSRAGAGRSSATRPITLLLPLALALAGCAEAPLPQTPIRRDDCLRQLDLGRLEAQLERCNAVVAAFPEDPAPLNDRYLLHVLAGNDTEACVDLRRALVLAERIPADQLDAQLRSDLTVREQLCDSPASPVPQ